MSKIKLNQVDFGLQNKPKMDADHDTVALLETTFDRTRGEYRDIPLRQICKNPHNDYAQNDSEQEISELAADIRRNGLLHNIVVLAQEDDRYLLLSGERRVRAFEWLTTHEQDNRWLVIHAKVLRGLSPLQQMIVLDAANLHTRGGIGSETRFRKAMVRFVQNLQQAEQITQEEAARLTAEQFEGIDRRLIDTNLELEAHLEPALRALLDRDLIPKRQAVLYARLPQEVQRALGETIAAANEKGRGALKQVNDQLREAVKQVSELRQQVEQHEKSMSEVSGELEQAQRELREWSAAADAGIPMDEARRAALDRRIQTLTAEKKRYAAAIREARQALQRNTEQMTRREPDTDGDALTALIGRKVARAVSAVNSVASPHTVSCIRRLEPDGRELVRKQLEDARRRLEHMLAQLS